MCGKNKLKRKRDSHAYFPRIFWEKLDHGLLPPKRHRDSCAHAAKARY
jgi:hypothetical protein